MKNLLMAGMAAVMPMTAQCEDVLVFAGSTRAESVNKKLAQEAARIAQGMGAKVTVIDLRDFSIPLYDADLEANSGMPKNAKRLRDLMIANQSIVIVSPEYNASIPAVLKNALDWASRGEKGGSSRNAFKGKKFALMSASPSGMGGSRALIHLRTIVEAVGGQVVEKQVSVPNAYEKGALDNSALQKELKEQLSQLMTNEVNR
jgi:NAD(P)H-dependent FMN reductase